MSKEPQNSSAPRKKIQGKTIFNICILVLSVALIVYFCLSEDGLIDLSKHVKDFKKVWLYLAIAGMLLDLVIDTILIYIFTKNAKNQYSMKHAFKTCMVGHLYSAVTPFQSGGQPMQIYVMSKQGIDPGVATSALVQKFFVYQSGLTFYSAFAIIFHFRFFKGTLSTMMWGLALVGFLCQAVVIVMLLLVSFNQNVTKKIISFICKVLHKLHIVKDYEKTYSSWDEQLTFFHDSNKDLYKDKVLLIKTYALTFLQLTALFVVSYCIYRAFDFNQYSVFDMICAQAFVTMVSSLVPLPGAAGASEGSFVVFFAMFFTPGTIKSAVLLWRIITYYAVILISAPFSRITDKMQESKKNN
jgi:uncharacterized protein (TIRG00374 family)